MGMSAGPGTRGHRQPRLAEHADDGSEGMREITEHILDTGLEPAQPAPVLPRIEREDIEVICWMAIEPVK